MGNRQQGFTLIELMIVIAILGILASIAIPAYRDYTIKAKISEALYIAGGVETSVSEYHSTNGNFPSTTVEAGILQVVTDYITSITIIAGAVAIEIDVDATGISDIPGTTTMWLRMIPTAPTIANSAYMWDCTIDSEPDGTGGDYIISRFVPADCR